MISVQCPGSRGDKSHSHSQPRRQLCHSLPAPLPLQSLAFPFCTFSDLTGANLDVIRVKQN